MAEVTIYNASFARNFTVKDTGERVCVAPGTNEMGRDVFDRLSREDSRFCSLIEGGVLAVDEADLGRIAEQVASGDLAISDVVPARDATAVVGRIDDVQTLVELYRQSNRVGVRTVIVRRLRALGFTGDIN